MWFSLFCLALLLAIAFFQSIHGLFNSVVFFVLSVLCAVLAFALHEWIAYSFLMQWKPDFALPIALAGVFGLLLTIARLVLDSVVQRAPLLPAMVERIGGGVFGLLTALLIVGVLATAAQMLPFGGTVMGFARFEEPKQSEEEEQDTAVVQEAAEQILQGEGNNLLLQPDRFAAGFVSMLSDGVFSGRRSFRADHPSLLTEIGWSQCAAPGSRRVAEPQSLQVDELRKITHVYKKTLASTRDPETKYEMIPPKGNHEFWVVALTPGTGAMDSDKQHRFRLPQIRLVGKDEDDDEFMQLVPRAIRDHEELRKHVTEIVKGRDTTFSMLQLYGPEDDGTIEVVFEVPRSFKPEYIAYKTGARKAITAPGDPDEQVRAPQSTPAEPDKSTRTTLASARQPESKGDSGSSKKATRRGGGRVSGARPMRGGSAFSDVLPLTLTDYRGREIEAHAPTKALQSGHVVARIEGQGDQGAETPIARFQVPEGVALLQLNVEYLQAKSTYGRALSYAVKTIRNYLVTDDLGDKYEMIGQYVMADVDGDSTIEIQYFPEQIGSMGRGVRKFDEVKERHLKKKDTQLYYLFLIKKGRKVVKFSTGRGSVDLRGDNLVAP
jgi:hypothetical protein